MATSELDRLMAKLAAQGITIGTTLAAGVPETDRPATRIRDAARRAGIDYEPHTGQTGATLAQDGAEASTAHEHPSEPAEGLDERTIGLGYEGEQ